MNIEPFFMYGTAWKEDKTEKLTLQALNSGFRAIDTANQRKHYFEEGVGNAITQFVETGEVGRENLFLQTKFTYKEGQDHRLPYDPKTTYSKQVEQSFQSSLEHLQTDYIDSYILHGPSTRRGLNEKDYEVWAAMEGLLQDGLTKHIGVSNITAPQLQLLLEKAENRPEFVQNRCFAHHGWDLKVRELCKQHDITYQGFSLLTANREYLNHQKIQQIAQSHELPIPSIIFRFAIQIGMLPLTGTTNEDHMEEDLKALEYTLTRAEIDTIEKIAL